MTYSKNLVVVSLLGVLVGTLASIGTLQYAQVVAFSGMNPNAVQAEEGIQKQSPTCVNPRSIMENLFSGLSKQRPCPSVNRQASAPAPAMHGAPSVIDPANEECAKTANPRRRAACNEGKRLTNETNR